MGAEAFRNTYEGEKVRLVGQQYRDPQTYIHSGYTWAVHDPHRRRIKVSRQRGSHGGRTTPEPNSMPVPEDRFPIALRLKQRYHSPVVHTLHSTQCMFVYRAARKHDLLKPRRRASNQSLRISERRR